MLEFTNEEIYQIREMMDYWLRWGNIRDAWDIFNRIKPIHTVPGVEVVTTYQLAEHFGIQQAHIWVGVQKLRKSLPYKVEQREVYKKVPISTLSKHAWASMPLEERKWEYDYGLGFEENGKPQKFTELRFANFTIDVPPRKAGVHCLTPKGVMLAIPYFSGSMSYNVRGNCLWTEIISELLLNYPLYTDYFEQKGMTYGKYNVCEFPLLKKVLKHRASYMLTSKHHPSIPEGLFKAVLDDAVEKLLESRRAVLV